MCCVPCMTAAASMAWCCLFQSAQASCHVLCALREFCCQCCLVSVDQKNSLLTRAQILLAQEG